MINRTKGVLFHRSGEALESDIRQALDAAAGWVLKLGQVESIDLATVTTKTNLPAAFAALARQHLLLLPKGALGEQYVNDALMVYTLPFKGVPPEHFYLVTLDGDAGRWAYKASYGPRIRKGLGAFLVALHIRGAITLPFLFDWPRGYVGGEVERELCDLAELPELLRLIRSLEFEDANANDPVFTGFTSLQRKHLWTYGTKLLLSLGWREPEDASFEDLIELKKTNDKDPFAGPHVFNQVVPLLDVLERKYKGRAPVTVSEWRNHSLALRANKMVESSLSGMHDVSAEDALETSAVQVTPAGFSVDRIGNVHGLPGLDIDVAELSSPWRVLEEAYIRKIQRESYKPVQAALSYFNVYLFFYLPNWYALNEGFDIPFPDGPDKLLSSVFVADLGLTSLGTKPRTLTEFLDLCSHAKEWKGQSHYAMLLQLKRFFEYLERHASELPRCQGFRQPLSAEDFPATARTFGTNKRPIPRRVFPLFVAYAECLAAMSEALLERIVSGEVAERDLDGMEATGVLDTFRASAVTGFVPVVFCNGKTYPLRYVPNVLQTARFRVKAGQVLRLPQPHALHQIIVALHTGIRNNHIQWLDLETFDTHYVPEDGGEFTRLYVNTDKVKTTGWSPYVHSRVLVILLKQKRWRELIDENGFHKKVSYNNNERTKWGAFYPLFSALDDGQPHPDSRYMQVWKSLVMGVQGLLGDVGERSIELCRLLPANMALDDPNLDRKLRDHGRAQKLVCDLEVKTRITPHSARVSVVSHSITVLPADVIGRYLTGQNEATVFHYVALDEEEVYAEQQLQKLALRDRGYKSGYDAMLKAVPQSDGAHVCADSVNASLVNGVSRNLEETIVSHGLTSFTLQDAIKTGVEVLRETSARGAVFNKTEICPYGNRCPGDVLKQLGAVGRCSLCPYAVRSVDHLPAVTAKVRQVGELLLDVEARLDSTGSLTPDESDSLGTERAQLAEDLAAWRLVEEVLEMTRQRITAGASSVRWVVQKPEIVERHLRREPFPSQETEYVLARLIESEAYPTLESPHIRARFDLLRRQLLANLGNMKQALSLTVPSNPAAECLGLIRSVVAANKLSYREVLALLRSDDQLEAHPQRPIGLLTSDAE